MPVYARDKQVPIPPFGKVDVSGVLPVLNAPEIQRLRNSTQLAFSRYSFPGAEHSRYTHSLAVMGNTTELVNELFARDFFEDVDRTQLRIDLQIAALVHDAGHPPFGHP